jgi:hypothetical protein
MKKKNNISKIKPFIPLIATFIIGFGLLSMANLVAGSSQVQQVTSASAQRPKINRSKEPQIMCPQVMHTCPDGNWVPLLPEYKCQPQCSTSPSNIPEPTIASISKPKTTKRPLATPTYNPIATAYPTPIATTNPSVCPKVPPPDLICLGGMPVIFDQSTCTYRCEDYRMLQ